MSTNILRGALGDYEYEEEHFDSGGFARIYRARNQEGSVVALKRLHVHDEEARGRLRREIQEQTRIEHPAVMPVVDHDPAFGWFVMPLADENLAARVVKEQLSDSLIIQIVRSSAEGLDAAHKLGLVHRDVSPRNILRIGEQWVVADWGVVRRPRGLTTMIRTQGELGTNGFAAPELFREAHVAGPSADVYALGRIVAWAKLRKWPEQNIQMLPDGPWRHFVRRTTMHEPKDRVANMTELLSLLGDVDSAIREGGGSDPDVKAFAPDQVRADSAIATMCLEQCATSLDDATLFLEYLPAVPKERLKAWVINRTSEIEKLVQAMETHGRQRDVSSGHRMSVCDWLRRVAALAEAYGAMGLLEDAAGALFRIEPLGGTIDPKPTRAWLDSLQGESARTVGRVLDREFFSGAVYVDVEWPTSSIDPAIDRVLRNFKKA